MQRDSNLHNPRVDDAMAKEASSMTHGAPVEARTDEERLVEDGADWEPVAQALVASGATDGDTDFPYQAVRDRSELARHLRPSIFPATRAELVACAVEEHADPDLVEQLGALPERVYHTTNEVWTALGGETEHATAGYVETPTARPDTRATPQRFEFRFDRLYEIAALPFGVTHGRAFVELGAETLVASFGFWRVETPIENVAHVERTGPYAVPKTIGPPHISLADGGLTFATTNTGGVCIRFYEAVRGIEPVGVVRHPALTVTVADPDALIEALSE